MLLVAYLRGIGKRAPDAGERASLGPMITVSSNDAADTIYYRVGDAALYRLARLAGWRASRWPATGGTPTSAPRTRRASSTASTGWCRGPRAVRARSALLDRELPALGLLPLLARRGVQDLLQGRLAWNGAGQLVHEAALFERGDTRISMAVLTDGNPSHEYGTNAARGCARISSCEAASGRVGGAAANRSLDRTDARPPRRAARAGPWLLWTSTASRRHPG